MTTEKIDFPMSSLEIMQACLESFKKNSKKPEVEKLAAQYLEKVNSIINGNIEYFTSSDFIEIHKFVITTYATIFKELTGNYQKSQQWKKVLEYIEEYMYSGTSNFEVSLKIKK